MRNLLIIMLTFICMLNLAACNSAVEGSRNPTEPELEENAFIAKVLDIYPSSYLIRPIAGEDERGSADKMIVSANPTLKIEIGDFVKVIYDGLVLESYPALVQKAEVQAYNQNILDLPSLTAASNYSHQELARELFGLTKAEIVSFWGQPDVILDNEYGCIWYTDETKTMKVSVYYDSQTNLVESCSCTPGLTPETVRIYEYTINNDTKVMLKIWSGGTFKYTENILGTRIRSGTWTQDANGTICIKEYPTPSVWEVSPTSKNYFRVIPGGLQWIAKDSDGFPTLNISDGAIFTMTQ